MDFGFLGSFLAFRWPWIGLTRSLECFLGVGSKHSWKWDFWVKNNGPHFFSHHNGWILGWVRWRIIFFFFCKIWGLNLKKKRLMLGPSVVGLSAGRCIVRLGIGPDLPSSRPGLVFFFVLFFCFLKYNALFVYIFSNKFLVCVLIRLLLFLNDIKCV